MTRPENFIRALAAWGRYPLYGQPSFGQAGSISRALAERRRRKANRH